MQEIESADGVIWETLGAGVDRIEGDSVTDYLAGSRINEIAMAPGR